MNLKTLLSQIETLGTDGSVNVEVTGVQYDSRRVTRGNIFVALKGERTDGHAFVEQAVANGASAVVTDRTGSFGGKTAVIRVADTTEALGRLSAAFYDFPSRQLKIAGVTGTNGKTTFTFLLKSIPQHHGMRTGLLGTIRYELGERQIPAERTTPQSSDLQGLLAQMKSAGCKGVVMEVSSHSLVQKRVEGVEFDVGVFTNLTQDHLDYHKTMQEYARAKGLLFSGLGRASKKQTSAVLNFDDPQGPAFRALLGRDVSCMTYGCSEGVDLRATDLKLSLAGTRFVAITPAGRVEVVLQLCGRYNVENALAALGAALALGVPLNQAVEGLGQLTHVPGRLEAVREGQPFHVFVDYAHTDDALKNVLTTLKDLVKARLIVVFGCGGNRDAGKRPIMGRVAAQKANNAMITKPIDGPCRGASGKSRSDHLGQPSKRGSGTDRPSDRIGIRQWFDARSHFGPAGGDPPGARNRRTGRRGAHCGQGARNLPGVRGHEGAVR
jgi:UDP-N-acetylmuramoyl-L-alanyl-D-glutamate--2,6-diaminopimelate ligase